MSLKEEIKDDNSSKQIEWLLECYEDMLLSCTRTSTVCNDFKNYEDIRYTILQEDGVSKVTPINASLLHPAFQSVMNTWISITKTH